MMKMNYSFTIVLVYFAFVVCALPDSRTKVGDDIRWTPSIKYTGSSTTSLSDNSTLTENEMFQTFPSFKSNRLAPAPSQPPFMPVSNMGILPNKTSVGLTVGQQLLSPTGESLVSGILSNTRNKDSVPETKNENNVTPLSESLTFDDKFRSLEELGVQKYLSLSGTDITPEAEDKFEDLYPFPELFSELEDPITTVSVVKAVISSDPALFADIIETRDDDQAIADGLKIPFQARDRLNSRTPDRNDDGDVVAFKGFAQAALDGQSAESLANIFILSLSDVNNTYGMEITNPFVKEISYVRSYLEELFLDEKFLQDVLEVDANEIKVHVFYQHGRKLKVVNGSPVESQICSYCYPKRSCKHCFWCHKPKPSSG